ncbi:MAG: peptidoglycan DD-metalloendopeptidase family protein [Burkholderiales bacterium]
MLIETKWAGAWVLAITLLTGCTLTPHRAPVEDRLPGAKSSVVVAASAAASAPVDAAKPLPGAENAGKPGYYMIKTGDTLIRIGLETGQNWKDLAKWNNIDNPSIIEVGQVLRVVPPGIDGNGAATRPVTTAKVETRPLDGKPPATAASGSFSAASGSPVAPAVIAPMPATAPSVTTVGTPSRDGDDEVHWGWPANGSVAAPFDDAKVKGLQIGGKAGDPVFAAADGRVVYAGSGLRGYGNLIILKHNNTYLTAYAHNQTLLVKEDQSVKRGQKIAEMGSTDADGVKLHFEIRKLGKPIDPAKLLPPR